VERLKGTPSTVRAINDRLALELLFEHGELSRSQLVALAGVSKPTAAELLGRLESDGVVVRRGLSTGGRGPSAQLYAVNEDLAHVCAINAEADRACAAIANIAGGIIAEASVEADFTDGRDPVPVLRKVMRRAAAKAGIAAEDVKAVVVGVTGAYDPGSDRVVYAGHLPGWERPDVMSRLRSALGENLVVENDANLAAVGERTRGCARSEETFALLWVATGLGLALELGGHLYRGATGGAGEVGYIPIGGRAACFQDSVGGPAVVALARRHGIMGPSPEAVIAVAHERGEAGQAFLSELAERLATGVATIAAVIDPPLLVLTGATMTAGGPALLDLVSAEVARVSPFRTRLSLSGVDGDSVLAGAIDTAVARCRAAVFGNPPSRPWAPTSPRVAG
jgi:predicted NBD/HSP70 family sugar kinase